MVSPSVSAPHAVKQHIAFEEMALCFADDTINDVEICVTSINMGC
jgi:hypothetical protein